MSVWHRIKVRLGLEDDWDDEYDEDYDNEYHTAEEPEERPRSGGFYGRSVYDSPSGSESTSVKRVNRDADSDWGREAGLGRVDAGPLVRSSYRAERGLGGGDEGWRESASRPR